MVEVRNLTKRYGANLAVDHVSFTIEEGSIVGFLGPNGAGKSTTMNIVTGYLSASEGSVAVSGKNTLDDPNEVKRLIGYLPEQPPLYMDMTVKEYLDFVYELKKAAQPKKQHIQEICQLAGKFHTDLLVNAGRRGHHDGLPVDDLDPLILAPGEAIGECVPLFLRW